MLDMQVWFPVNIVFVGMIWSSFLALKNLGVPMVTVLKNLTNLITISGGLHVLWADLWLRRLEHHGPHGRVSRLWSGHRPGV